MVLNLYLIFLISGNANSPGRQLTNLPVLVRTRISIVSRPRGTVGNARRCLRRHLCRRDLRSIGAVVAPESRDLLVPAPQRARCERDRCSSISSSPSSRTYAPRLSSDRSIGRTSACHSRTERARTFPDGAHGGRPFRGADKLETTARVFRLLPPS